MAGSISHVSPGAACDHGRVVIHGRELRAAAAAPAPRCALATSRPAPTPSVPSRLVVPRARRPRRRPHPDDDRRRRRRRADRRDRQRDLARGLHQVDNPAVDSAGRIYLTYSGVARRAVPVSIFRVSRDGTREPFVTGLVNPTSMTSVPTEQLYVSSRFEGVVYAWTVPGSSRPPCRTWASPAAWRSVPTATMFVGDRSGTMFRVRVQRAGDDDCDVAAVRGGVSSGDGPRSVPLRHRADADVARLRLSRASRRRGRSGVVRIRPSAGAGVFGPDGCCYVVEALAGQSGSIVFARS